MMRLAGSDVVLQSMERTGMAASDAVVAAARAELGLDKPFLTQYFTWLGSSSMATWDAELRFRDAQSLRPSFAKLPATLLLTGCLSVSHFSYHCRSVFFGGQSKPLGRLGDPQSEFCGQQHPQLLCGTPFALHLCYSTAVAAGDFTSAHC